MDFLRFIAFFIALVVMGGVVLVARMMQHPARIRKAEEFFAQGDTRKAGEIVKKVLDKKPDFVPARYLRARMLILQRQYVMAISELTGILGLSDMRQYVNEVEIHYHLAMLYKETKQFPREVDEYKVILTFNPNDIRANHRIGHVLFKQKNFQSARDHLLRAYSQDASLVDALFPLGASYFNLGDYSSAEQHLLRSLETGTDTIEAQYMLGIIYKSRKDYDTALRMFSNTQVDRRFYIKSLYQVGEIYFERDEYDEAIRRLEPGLSSLQPKTDEALEYRYLLAECYEHGNKIAEALYHWEQINEQNPGYRGIKGKLDDYRGILEDERQRALFTSSLEELQPLITEIIARLNYNVLSKKPVGQHEYQFRAFNVKRMNDPPLLINFNRTTREITEAQLEEFHKRMDEEKCRSGIYITTSRFSIKAKNNATTMLIDLVDTSTLTRLIERIMQKKDRG
ncbi:MAG: tetratricopeptide repeat protein [Spirochaetes bacterium]|nr:MAG: tetratricopeptide repeat protein [Spirochaetota bacterium]